MSFIAGRTPGCNAAFAEAQPIYAEHGIATFPVTQQKLPAVRGYLKMSLAASRKLRSRLGAAPAIGFATNQRNGITVLDIDSPNERDLRDALDRHGDTPLIARTGSGNFHAYYRHAGERRKIRPWPGKAIDLLGEGGMVVAPPSHITSGQYQFIAGSLDDVSRLPTLRNLGLEKSILPPKIREGQRNTELWRHCMISARHCDDFDALLDVARTFNEHQCDPKLEEAEVVATAQSAWRYEDRGQNVYSARRCLTIPVDVGDKLARGNGGDALLLLYNLQRKHWNRDHFILANAFAEELGWSLQRFRKARTMLLEVGRIHLVRKGGRFQGDPPVYRWPRRSDWE